MVRAVGRRHVPHDVGDRADPVQIVRTGLGNLGIALHQNANLALLPHRLLDRGDRLRPANGDRGTMPGNSTVLRTGRRMAASAGSGTLSGRILRAGGGLPDGRLSVRIGENDHRSLLRPPSQAEHHAAVRREAPDAVPPWREGNAALEAALRQFKAVDYGGTQLRGQDTQRPLTTRVPSSITR